MSVHVIDHPMVQHKLSIMRDKKTSTSKFRQALQEISMLMMGSGLRSMVKMSWFKP